jgi:uncharacterized membrane-anchored protein YhcB (DUF1043 family)
MSPWPLVGIGLLVGAFLGGWHARGVKADADQLKVVQAQQAKDRADNTENGKVTDELLKDRAAFAAAAASSADRLRKLSSTRSSAATACSQLDEPAAAVIPDGTRTDLEHQADTANEVAVNLMKLQDYVRRVCRPE